MSQPINYSVEAQPRRRYCLALAVHTLAGFGQQQVWRPGRVQLNEKVGLVWPSKKGDALNKSVLHRCCAHEQDLDASVRAATPTARLLKARSVHCVVSTEADGQLLWIIGGAAATAPSQLAKMAQRLPQGKRRCQDKQL